MSSSEGVAERGAEHVVLACKAVTKVFRARGKQIRALDGVDLALKRGEVAVISGRTGAGKTTLLHILGGLDRQDSGSVLFEGRQLEELANRHLATLRREKIGIIFQSFNLLPAWTARENVEAALMPAGLRKAERRVRAEAALSRQGLDARFDHLPSELSMGEQQRVAIARTLAGHPTLILADEPTGDVDEGTARGILDQLLAPVKTNGAALLIATHGLVREDMANRVLWLEDGRLSPEE